MKHRPPITEDDFRLDEFKGKNPKDYEFRESDNKIVRKDRFEIGMHRLAQVLGRGVFEIDEITRMIAVLVRQYPDRVQCDECNQYDDNHGVLCSKHKDNLKFVQQESRIIRPPKKTKRLPE